ncbi:PaaI family thioesterase [Qipengyuania sp.]|uniref:PaaI family thioesterase n=1 Tax=Qipengyuania sp. TaxID=2004515 RepID=UPI0035C78DDB
MAFLDEIFEHGPDPENPGWRHWNLRDDTLFNGAVMGRMITRVDDDGRARLRMFPERCHMNLQRIIHGAVTLSLIDISLFTTMHTTGRGHAGPAVTLELSTQFVGSGQLDRPLDAVGEIVRETGSMVFVRGTVEQDTGIVASFSGIMKKIRTPSAG